MACDFMFPLYANHTSHTCGVLADWQKSLGCPGLQKGTASSSNPAGVSGFFASFFQAYRGGGSLSYFADLLQPALVERTPTGAAT